MSVARPFTVALTGGVASGKTEVERRFAALGARVIDADVVARELVEPGGPALDAIVHTFGAEVLDPAGGLDRAAMRKRVFADADARARLEAILHPRIREILRQRSDAILEGYALLVIPLLVESGEYMWVDRVLVVDVAPETQIARLVARDGITEDLARSMLTAQATRAARHAGADDLIDNNGAPSPLDAHVAPLHRR
jgi:dephospho-CoA kinase